MAKEERKTLHAPTHTEVTTKTERGQELELHKDFQNWCNLHHIVFVHSRTDRKPTIAEGHPDFTLLYGGRGCCVEFKAGKSQPTPEQRSRLEALGLAKVPYLVAWDLKSAIVFAAETLQIPLNDT